MWPSVTPPTSRPDTYFNNNRPPPRGTPTPTKSGTPSCYDAPDGIGGGYYEAEPENMEESLEEIAELEGELSSDDGEMDGSGLPGMDPRKASPFSGIDFNQLFTASNIHSEQLIELARIFYPVSTPIPSFWTLTEVRHGTGTKTKGI